ncbi:MAG: hypothetical protein WD077_14620 [Bacteroidia bacterium]
MSDFTVSCESINEVGINNETDMNNSTNNKAAIEALLSLRLEVVRRFNKEVESLDTSLRLLGYNGKVEVPNAFTNHEVVSKELKKMTRTKWPQKVTGNVVLHVIKELNHFAHPREVGEWMQQKNLVDLPLDAVISKVSATISNLKRNGKLVKHQVGSRSRNCFYGFEDWMENDKIKPDYDYNELFYNE